MNEEHPNKKPIERHWFGQLDQETQQQYEDEMISRKFEEANPSDDDKKRAKRKWEIAHYGLIVDE